MSGYDIKCYLKGLTWLIGSPSFGNLYPTLHGLLVDGLTTVEECSRGSKASRKVYSVTDEGRAAAEEWVRRPIRPNAPLRSFLMRLILADVCSPTGLIAHLEQRRAWVASQQEALEQERESWDGRDGSEQGLAYDYGLALAQTELAWLDEALGRLYNSGGAWVLAAMAEGEQPS